MLITLLLELEVHVSKSLTQQGLNEADCNFPMGKSKKVSIA